VDTGRTVELALQELSEQLTAPRPAECLSCYLTRMLAEFGCAGHRFTRRWARGRPRGTPDGLVRWAGRLGGCCCDCEVVLNVLGRRAARQRAGVLCAAAATAPDATGRACSGVEGGR
jgi:hypothetical protein